MNKMTFRFTGLEDKKLFERHTKDVCRVMINNKIIHESPEIITLSQFG